MTIEQRARDLLRESSALSPEDARLTRREYPVLDAACRALEAHDATQASLTECERDRDGWKQCCGKASADFDAYRREVSENLRAYMAKWRFSTPPRSDFESHFGRFIIPEPVDPLTEACQSAGEALGMADWPTFAIELRAALAKIGGQVVFGEGA